MSQAAKATFLAEILGIIVLVVYTAYTIKIYSASKESADAAKSAAIVATKALNASIEQFRTDERAWVEIDRIERTMVSPRDNKFGATFRYRLYPRNVGKTSAHDITVSAARNMMGDIGLESNADNMRRAQDLLLDRSPSGPGPVENPVPRVLAPETTAAVPFVMDGQEPQIFARSEWASFLVGRIDYSDNWGIKHWMKFCFYVANGNGELWNCHAGNEEDSNPEMPSEPKR